MKHLLLILLIIATSASAAVINIPDDFETIQAGIDDAEDGDTVLVAPGEYVENIDFGGTNFTLLGKPDDPEEVVIDGSEEGSVVTFANNENAEAIINGFTIQNGLAERGGGIFCDEASPTIINCIITGNTADGEEQNYGGGIYLVNSEAAITQCQIRENLATLGGGGIGFIRSSPIISKCLIWQNHSEDHTSGIYSHFESNSQIINCTIILNQDDSERGVIRASAGSRVSIVNCIIDDNQPNILRALDDEDLIEISYTDLRGGREAINGNVEWGEGNIDEDPLFVDPDEDDFHLTVDSPCIDTGDPDSPEDPDETRADMGAFYFHQWGPVINVPDDFETIQEAIDAAFDTDTVLVAPGRYEENINFSGKAIVVMGDPENPEEVVIDAGGAGTVVTINSGETETSVLIGFTITNANGQLGGGVNTDGTSPRLEHLIIADNNAVHGGGIWIYREASPTLTEISFLRNTVRNYGANVACYASEVTMRNITIVGDEEVVAARGGGVLVYNGVADLDHVTISNCNAEKGGGLSVLNSEVNLSRVVINNNIAEEGGAIYVQNSSILNADFLTVSGNRADIDAPTAILADLADDGIIVLSNSIFWEEGGEDNPAMIFNEGEVSISYCEIEGGQDEIINNSDLTWGEGNIDQDPMWVDPGEGDFSLAGDSPCIDAGDPGAERDPDSTRADMGAIPYFRTSMLHGYVYDSLTEQPLEGVTLTTSDDRTAMSDTTGRWIMETFFVGVPFDLTASLDGFIDSTVVDLLVDVDDTVEVIFSLLHPMIEMDPSDVQLEVEIDSAGESEIALSNPGNYPMLWRAQRRSFDVVDPWSLIQSHYFGQAVDDERLEGVVFINDHFYVSGGGQDQNYIYVFDRDGNSRDMFAQPGESVHGVYDLAWDGELIWSGDNRSDVYGFTTDGDVMRVWEGPNNSNQGFAWDPDRELLWIAGIVSNEIVGYRRGGDSEASIDQFDLRIYGLSYWADDPDGYPLYVLHSPNFESSVVHKIDIDNEDTLFVAALEHEEGGRPRGAYISSTFEPAQLVFMNMVNNDDDDRVDIWMLDADPTWLTLAPEEGELDVDGEEVMTLTMSAENLDLGVYEAEVAFEFVEVGGGVVINVEMQVIPLGVEDTDGHMPLTFAIESIHPNPFNSSTTITYTVPHLQSVSLRLYDLQGREALTLHDGYAQPGTYNLSIDGSGLSSGIYFVSLESLSGRQMRKLALVR